MQESLRRGSFSSPSARERVAAIAQRLHPIGSVANEAVRRYLCARAAPLGLQPEVQQPTGLAERRDAVTAGRFPTTWRGCPARPRRRPTIRLLPSRQDCAANHRLAWMPGAVEFVTVDSSHPLRRVFADAGHVGIPHVHGGCPHPVPLLVSRSLPARRRFNLRSTARSVMRWITPPLSVRRSPDAFINRHLHPDFVSRDERRRRSRSQTHRRSPGAASWTGEQWQGSEYSFSS